MHSRIRSMIALVVMSTAASCAATGATGDDPELAAEDAEQIGACSAPGAGDFFVHRGRTITKSFDGYGAQFNENLYAAISAADGVTPTNVKVAEARMHDLAPQLVRI